jgi:hypothetical protein
VVTKVKLRKRALLKEEDNVLFTTGIRTFKPHASYLIEIHKVNELLEFEQRAPDLVLVKLTGIFHKFHIVQELARVKNHSITVEEVCNL